MNKAAREKRGRRNGRLESKKTKEKGMVGDEKERDDRDGEYEDGK